MKHIIISILLGMAIAFSFTTCKKKGCTDPIAENFDSDAGEDDGSCTYIYGCTDISASNYNPNATKDDGKCTYTGDVTFWQSGSPAYDVTIVTIESNLKFIWSDYPNGPTSCNATNCANFTLDVGPYYFTQWYTYIAEENIQGGETWGGQILIERGKCLKVELQ